MLYKRACMASALLLMCSIAVSGRSLRSDTTTRKNVLFLVVDDFRMQIGDGSPKYNKVPHTAKMHTPNMNKLIGKSAFFPHAQVQQAICGASRSSFLTSRRPDTTRMWQLSAFFRDSGGNFTTIPQYFKEHHGYAKSEGFGKIFHPTPVSAKWGGVKNDVKFSWDAYYSPTDDGAFEHDWKHVPGDAMRQDHECPSNQNHKNGACAWGIIPDDVAAKFPPPDTQTASHAVNKLKKWDNDGVENFFMAVGFHKPHLPFVCPQKYFDMYPESVINLPKNPDPPVDMPSLAWNHNGEILSYPDIKKYDPKKTPGTHYSFDGSVPTHRGNYHGDETNPQDHVMPDEATKALRRAYYACVSHSDHELGRVLTALEGSRFADNTIITLVGDHGWQLGEHGIWAKHSNFHLATNAPFAVHVPGMTPQVSTQYAEFVDLFPTIVEAATGAAMPRCPKRSCKVKFCTQGVSLIPAIKDSSLELKTAAFSQYPRCNYVKGHKDNCWARSKKLKPALKHGMSACLRTQCTMGYSVVTRVNGIEYRYTEWRDFNTPAHPFAPDWSDAGLQEVELYDHSDDYDENYNIFPSTNTPSDVKAALASLLKKCAVTGCTGKDMTPPSDDGTACPKDMSSSSYVRLSGRCSPTGRGNALGGNHKGASIAQCAKLCEQTTGCAGFEAGSKCGKSHNEKCCYLKRKCEGNAGRYGFGHRMRTCGDMYPPEGQVLLADKDHPCGSDCDGCFSGSSGGGWKFGKDGDIVVVHG